MVGGAQVPATATEPAEGPDCDFALPLNADTALGLEVPDLPHSKYQLIETWALITPNRGTSIPNRI